MPEYERLEKLVEQQLNHGLLKKISEERSETYNYLSTVLSDPIVNSTVNHLDMAICQFVELPYFFEQTNKNLCKVNEANLLESSFHLMVLNMIYSDILQEKLVVEVHGAGLFAKFSKIFNQVMDYSEREVAAHLKGDIIGAGSWLRSTAEENT